MGKENVWHKYLAKYLQDMPPQKGGPVITISREFGCFVADIAELAIDKINQNYLKSDKHKWTLISKEILSRAAEELSLKPEKISHIFEGKEKSFFHTVGESFLKNVYVPDTKIKKTIMDVIKTYAWDGNVIIIGRASCVIAQNMKKSLHIKFIAPYDYRAKKVSERFQVSLKEAKELVVNMDKNRKSFMKFFTGDKNEFEFYDFIINRSKYDIEYLADLLIGFANDKNLF